MNLNILSKIYFILVCTALLCLGISCKHNHSTDPKLKQALQIQDEAIHLGMAVDSLIIHRLKGGDAPQDIEKLRRLKKQYDMWQANMILIPHVEHAHDHHHHDGHSHHDHDHSKEDIATQLTPDEQIKVQMEWKQAITQLRDSL